MIPQIIAAIALVTFHMVDGRVVQINPAAVQQLLHPHGGRNKLFVPGVKCVIRLSGGYVAVAETCEEVQQALEK